MASGSFASAKLNLRSTSKMSLSDRFKLVRQRALINRTLGVNKTKAAGSVQPRVSRKNLLLAQQMANKPSVLAALKIKKKSIKQRLGKVKPKPKPTRNRLFKANKPTQNQTGPQTSAPRFRLNRNNFVNTTRVASQKPRRGRNSNKIRNMIAQTSQVRQNPGNRSGRVSQNRFGNKNTKLFTNNRLSAGGGAKNNQARFGGRGLNRRRNNNANNKGVNQRNFNQRGFNQRRGNQRRDRRAKFQNQGQKKQGQNQGVLQQWQRKKNVNKSQLDKDLDEYMAKTRSQLDADLDAYMAGA